MPNLMNLGLGTTSLKTILAFVAPALTGALADPVMGLVDALCLGQSATTLELAALGPNLTVFNFISYAFFFLAAVTTIKTSKAVTEGDNTEAERIIFGALLVALCGGTIIATALVAFPQAILAATGALPGLIGPATAYARVRGLAVPAALATVVLQGGLLAQKDLKTPLIAIGGSVLLNIVGDVFLVSVCGMGLLGSAYATTAGVWIGVALLAWLGYGKGKNIRLRWAIPGRKFWVNFAKASAALCSVSLLNNASFFLVQAASTQLDVASCAAHQAVWAVWQVCAMAGFPLQQATQVFLTKELTTNSGGERSLITMLLKIATVAGLFVGVLCAGLAVAAPGLLARDPTLWPAMFTLAPWAFLSLVIVGMVFVLDGVLMSTQDAGFLAISQVVNVAGVAGALYLVLSSGHGISAVWGTMLLLYVARLAETATRVGLRGCSKRQRKSRTVRTRGGGAAAVRLSS